MSLTSLIIFAVVVAAQADAPPVATQPAQVTAPAAAPSPAAGDPALPPPSPVTPPSAWFPPASAPNSVAPPPPAGSAEPLSPPPPPPVDAEVAIRAAYQYAENQQGPLDGRWSLVGQDGTPLFAFVMADTGGAPSSRAASPGAPAIEGAWRDLRRAGGFTGSGLLASVTHLADTVEIHFDETYPGGPTVVTLHADAGGVWSGSLTQDGASRPVVMKRS